MNYLIQIIELVKHHQLPVWALTIISDVKMYYDGQPTSSRESVLQSIDRMINSITYTVRNSTCTGDNIPRVIIDNQMTIYSLSGNTEYIKIVFKHTEKPVIDPFNF